MSQIFRSIEIARRFRLFAEEAPELLLTVVEDMPSGVICSLYTINKSGGLIFQKSFVKEAVVDLNDRLRIASIWHSVSAIASQLSPVTNCAGIHLLEAETFDLHCFQTVTGTKFCLVVRPKTQNIPTFLNKIYELYSDYVLKNPFYEVEMPIRCELFEKHLEAAVQKFPII